MKSCFAKGCRGTGVHVKLAIYRGGSEAKGWTYTVQCFQCQASVGGADREAAECAWDAVLRTDDVLAAFDRGRRSVESTERGSAVGSASGS